MKKHKMIHPPQEKQENVLSIYSSILSILLAFVFGIHILHTTQKQSNLSQPKRTSFITRIGSKLYDGNKLFRFAGTNIVWLGYDYDYNKQYPTHFRVNDAFDTVSEMGETVVRSFTLGISTGCKLCLEPSLNKFNDEAFKPIDYSIKVASDHHVRLVIPLTKNLTPTDSKNDFVKWRGLINKDDFYTNPLVIHDFEHYIYHLLNHVNPYTGLALKDDPTIMAWETGNELGLHDKKWHYDSWTEHMAKYIKSIDRHHLIIDGHIAFNDVRLTKSALSLPSVDIYEGHYYPPNNLRLIKQDSLKAQKYSKVFFVEEYDWTSPRLLAPFLSFVRNTPSVSGDLYWSLFPHNDTYGYIQHNDGHTFHYPGDDKVKIEDGKLLRQHGFLMQRLHTPPMSIPKSPLLNPIEISSKGNSISWRGVVGGAYYSIERSSDNGKTWSTIVSNLTDNSLPWIDASSRSQVRYLYRIKPYNLIHIPGPYSNIVFSRINNL